MMADKRCVVYALDFEQFIYKPCFRILKAQLKGHLYSVALYGFALEFCFGQLGDKLLYYRSRAFMIMYYQKVRLG